MKKICLFSHDNQYQTKSYFIEQLARAFKRAGVETMILAPKNGALQAEHWELLTKAPPDFTFAFNCILPLDTGDYLWDLLGIPHIFWNLDPAIYIREWSGSPNIFIPCVDRFDTEFFQHSGFNRSLFLPHATDPELKTDPNGERPYDVVLLGSCYDHEALRERWQSLLPAKGIAVIEDAIDMLAAEPDIHFMQALAGTIKHHELSFEEVGLHDLCVYLDYYIRGKDRLELLCNVKQGEVHVFGEIHEWTSQSSAGWKEYSKALERINLHPPVDYPAALEIMSKTKVCLNSSPQFVAAGHERIFNGLALGSTVLSNTNLYLREEFTDGDGLILYDGSDWDQVNDRLAEFLASEELRCSALARGQEKVLAAHTWDQRVETLLARVRGWL